MKTIFINGTERIIENEDDSLRKTLSMVNAEFAQNSKVVSGIVIDGQEITEEKQLNLMDQPLNNLGKIEITVSNPSELALETLDTLEAYTDRIIQNINKAGTFYRDKNYISADSYFMKSIDGLDLFVQTIGGVKAALKMGMNAKVALAEATLISIMTDLLDAKKQNNYVMLSELLLQDLLESMTEWKKTVFPALRSRASS
jgi:hypothetical protein